MNHFAITHDDTDVLAADGVVVHVRDLGPDDLTALTALHAEASDRSIYFRFFSASRDGLQQYAARLAAPPSREHRALGAFRADRLAGVGAFDRIGEDAAEFALLVADPDQHHGIGTLLLEHLVAVARGAGLSRIEAEVLSENATMIDVIRHLGFPITVSRSGPETHVDITVDAVDGARPAIEERELSADLASLRPLLAPRSIAVVGAGHRDGGVGRELLRNIQAAGFAGAVYVVNTHGGKVLGLPCYPSVLRLPAPVDLAVLAVPAAAVLEAVQECGERGCRAAVVVGSGFREAGADGARLQDEVLAEARRYGMRLLGPNCIGLANTDPDVRLDATFGPGTVRPGPLAVVAQSGAFGVGLLAAAEQVGLGVSQFVSVGNKADVGGNDLLLAWVGDPRTRVIAMYLESVGDPRRFARIARSVARHTPILVVKSGRTDAGRRAGQSHTAAAASPDAAVDALLLGSGVLRMRTTGELLDAARVMACQPLPAGGRVAIVGNSGGPEILAADAASDQGLLVVEFDEGTRAALRAAGASGENPVDLGAAARPDVVAAVLHAVHASREVDAVLTVFTDIPVIDAGAIRSAVVAAARASEKPTVAVEVGAAPETVAIDGSPWSVPIFTFPEPAAAALGAAYRYVQARGVPATLSRRPTGLQTAKARQLVTAALGDGREWLPPNLLDSLLICYGIPHCPQQVVGSAAEAVSVVQRWGYPVAVKLAGAGLHKTDIGGVRLNLADADSVRAAADELLALDCDTSAGLLLQPMVPTGVELIAGGVHDSQFGPLLMLGAGGVLTDVLKDRTLRLAPISEVEAESMIDDLHTARLLDGYRGTPAVDRGAVRDVLVRLGFLLDDLPEVAELDLNPLICRGEQVLAVDARVRVAPPPYHPDPLVRQLRAGHGPPT